MSSRAAGPLPLAPQSQRSMGKINESKISSQSKKLLQTKVKKLIVKKPIANQENIVPLAIQQ
jgi:hypothetical protein